MTHKKKGKLPFKKKGASPVAPARRGDHGSGNLIRKAYAKRGGK